MDIYASLAYVSSLSDKKPTLFVLVDTLYNVCYSVSFFYFIIFRNNGRFPIRQRVSLLFIVKQTNPVKCMKIRHLNFTYVLNTIYLYILIQLQFRTINGQFIKTKRKGNLVFVKYYVISKTVKNIPHTLNTISDVFKYCVIFGGACDR